MAFDKKPSMYPDRSTIGSAEELDAYGVWVKSEPQDLTASLAEAVNFDPGAIPYGNNFDTDYGDMGMADIDSPDSYSAEDITIPEYDHTGFDEAIAAGADTADEDDDSIDITGINSRDTSRTTEEVSTQLLMKIADELSSIRSELSTLKREFADIRAESGSGPTANSLQTDGLQADGLQSNGLQADESLSLTGDEMNNILTASDFSDGMDIAFDPRREADEAALRELSGEGEGEAENEEGEEIEEIEIDFDNLGIDLDTPEVPVEETPVSETVPAEPEAIPELTEDIVSAETETDELRALRMEGVTPLAPVPDEPDDINYLEGDPFVLDKSAFEDTPLESVNDSSLNENSFADISEFNLDESDFDLSLNDFSADDTFALDVLDDEQSFDTTLDLSETMISEPDPVTSPIVEPPEVEEPSAYQPTVDKPMVDRPTVDKPMTQEPAADEPALEEITFEDDFSLDMDDMLTDNVFDTFDDKEASLEDAGIALVVPEGFEIDAEEAPISLDDDLEAFAEDELSIDMGETVLPEAVADAEALASAAGNDSSSTPVLAPSVDVPVEEAPAGEAGSISPNLKSELKDVLSYMDHLLESLPEEKIEEFAKSEYFDAYRKIFKELGLV